MGFMLRSDNMRKCQMYLQLEVVYDVLADLGEIDCVDFIDLYPELQLINRRFVYEVCRYSEMEVKLDFLRRAMDQFKIDVPEQSTPSVPIRLEDIGKFEVSLNKWTKDLQEMYDNEKGLLQIYSELCEYHYVLSYIGPMLGYTEVKELALLFKNTNESSANVHKTGRLMVLTGTVKRSQAAVFELLLWRAGHGLIFYRQAYEDKILIHANTRLEIRKVAFLAVCQGKNLSERVQKICDGFQITTFPCPETPELRAHLQETLVFKILDLEEILKMTRYIRCTYLCNIAKTIRWWQGSIKKSKAIYYTMNKFRPGDPIYVRTLVAECWIPEPDYRKVESILEKHSVKHESQAESFNSRLEVVVVSCDHGHEGPPSPDMPPTYNRTNKFTRGFQNLINAYGDSAYRELNPGLYTIITFPFLFALMFGDLGHGLILVLAAWYMLHYEEYYESLRSESEIWDILFGGRYVILLMGLFSCYTGFIYNDLFSRAFSLMDSYWMINFSKEKLNVDEFYSIDPQQETRRPYWFGEDPVWRMSSNKIMFENSYKMKMSIIFGVIHMTFGLCLSCFNYIHFRRYSSIYVQFIPEVMFLLLVFGWMAIMIFIKWILYSPKSIDGDRNTQCAPQILILFIDMALFSTSKEPNKGCKSGYMFDGQQLLQSIFLLVALASVPVLLLGTPLIKIVKHKKKKAKAMKALDAYKKAMGADPVLQRELEEEVQKKSETGEMMMLQGVHTIEYVLSTISHTASYLRLWALSLAHSQLSDMLWHMILAKSMHAPGVLIPIFALWAMFTLSILVVMEGLSAFLHCLRLHWVEFMSKFFQGGGRVFQPYSFAEIMGHRFKYDSTCNKFNIQNVY